MKKLIPWILLAALSAFLLVDHFKGKADLEKILEPYRIQKAADALVIADLQKDLKTRDDNIDQLNGELDSNATVIEALKKKAVDAEADVVEARKGWGEFSLAARAKLKELDDAWAKRFSLAQDEIKEWKKREGLWKAKEIEYLGKVSDLEEIIKAKDRTNAACEKAQKDVGNELIKARRASRLKTWVAVGLGVAGFFAGRA